MRERPDDLRVKKTIITIRTTFEQMLCEMPYREITVKELCERAMVNKKTFYRYYETMDFLLAEFQDDLMSEYLARVEGMRIPEDLEQITRAFFAYAAERGDVFERITCAGPHETLQREMTDHVLALMRKPSFSLFRETKRRFDEICKQAGLRYQLIPYFISSHPGCRLEDMAQLAVDMKQMGYRLEQIQDFTPTPMTLSTEAYYTGIDPATLKPVYVATTPADKADQRRLFFYYKADQQRDIIASLRRHNLTHFIPKLFPGKR